MELVRLSESASSSGRASQAFALPQPLHVRPPLLSLAAAGAPACRHGWCDGCPTAGTARFGRQRRSCQAGCCRASCRPGRPLPADAGTGCCSPAVAADSWALSIACLVRMHLKRHGRCSPALRCISRPFCQRGPPGPHPVQIDSYRRDGFIKLKDVLSKETLARYAVHIREEVRRRLGPLRPDRGRRLRVGRPAPNCPTVLSTWFPCRLLLGTPLAAP